MITRHNAPAILAVRFTAAGLIHWPDATSDRAYLRHPHRVTFHVTAAVQADHDHWDIDLSDFRDVAAAAFRSLAVRLGDFGAQSFEVLARRLATVLADRYERIITADVGADGDCGAQASVGPEVET